MELVLLRNEEVTTTSMIIADVFGREHKDVLKAIRDLECSADFSRRNFTPSDYTIRGKQYPIFYITKDGFMMLVMGFTGSKAAKFKELFISEFNRLSKLAAQQGKPSLLPTYERRILSDATKDCQEDMWNVFDESSEIMLTNQKEIGSVNEYDLVDGSIGSHWSKYREGKKWAVMHLTYWHHFEDKRGNQQCKCYQFSELQYFRIWLRNTYKKQLLGEYLKNKFKGDKLMYPKVLAFLPKLLPGKSA